MVPRAEGLAHGMAHSQAGDRLGTVPRIAGMGWGRYIPSRAGEGLEMVSRQTMRW